MLIALFLHITTFTTGYAGPLTAAAVLTVAADACLGVVAYRGRGSQRAAAVVAMLPTVLIVYDTFRRMA
jgi:hypothetical protein